MSGSTVRLQSLMTWSTVRLQSLMTWVSTVWLQSQTNMLEPIVGTLGDVGDLSWYTCKCVGVGLFMRSFLLVNMKPVLCKAAGYHKLQNTSRTPMSPRFRLDCLRGHTGSPGYWLIKQHEILWNYITYEKSTKKIIGGWNLALNLCAVTMRQNEIISEPE